jgi:hypothetical protein
MKIILIATCLALTGCTGFFFRPGFSPENKGIFADPPYIVKRGENYFLQRKYGTDGFYFFPEYKVKDGALWFSLLATSSSGNRTGRIGEIPIEGKKAISALKSGGAIWWSRDGSKQRLSLKEESP